METLQEKHSSIIADHSASMLHEVLCGLREKPLHVASLIALIAVCSMVLSVIAHSDVACIAIGAVGITALVVAGFRVK